MIKSKSIIMVWFFAIAVVFILFTNANAGNFSTVYVDSPSHNHLVTKGNTLTLKATIRAPEGNNVDEVLKLEVPKGLEYLSDNCNESIQKGNDVYFHKKSNKFEDSFKIILKVREDTVEKDIAVNLKHYSNYKENFDLEKDVNESLLHACINKSWFFLSETSKYDTKPGYTVKITTKEIQNHPEKKGVTYNLLSENEMSFSDDGQYGGIYLNGKRLYKPKMYEEIDVETIGEGYFKNKLNEFNDNGKVYQAFIVDKENNEYTFELFRMLQTEELMPVKINGSLPDTYTGIDNIFCTSYIENCQHHYIFDCNNPDIVKNGKVLFNGKKHNLQKEICSDNEQNIFDDFRLIYKDKTYKFGHLSVENTQNDKGVFLRVNKLDVVPTNEYYEEEIAYSQTPPQPQKGTVSNKKDTEIKEKATTKGKIYIHNNEKSIKNVHKSCFCKFKLKSPKQTRKQITLKWNKIKDVKKYEVIYGDKKISTKKNKVTIKKLKPKTYYKFVVLVNGDRSQPIYVATKGSKNKCNYIKVKMNGKYNVKKGKNIKVKAKAISKKGTKVQRKVSLRYEVSDTTIAKVSKNGVVKGLKKGKTILYVYAQNGVYAKKVLRVV